MLHKFIFGRHIEHGRESVGQQINIWLILIVRVSTGQLISLLFSFYIYTHIYNEMIIFDLFWISEWVLIKVCLCTYENENLRWWTNFISMIKIEKKKHTIQASWCLITIESSDACKKTCRYFFFLYSFSLSLSPSLHLLLVNFWWLYCICLFSFWDKEEKKKKHCLSSW